MGNPLIPDKKTGIVALLLAEFKKRNVNANIFVVNENYSLYVIEISL